MYQLLLGDPTLRKLALILPKPIALFSTWIDTHCLSFQYSTKTALYACIINNLKVRAKMQKVVQLF